MRYLNIWMNMTLTMMTSMRYDYPLNCIKIVNGGTLLTEGLKETQHTRIELDEENKSELEILYSFGVVLFEHTILSNDDVECSICYFAPSDVYDIVVIDKKNNALLKYESCSKLNEKYSSYFNLVNGQTIHSDGYGKLLCGSHSIEYVL